MDIAVDVINQELRVTPENLRHFAPGSKNFVRFVFNLESDWNGMTTLAQFAQDGVPYSIYLDGENSACLPREIGPGTCYLMLYGVNGTTKIGTTNRLTLYINDNHFVESASSTNLTPTLYEQLVSQIQAVKTAVGAPLTAATAGAMTNTGKIYVYTGSEDGYTYGDWYYHNGTSWTSGGSYTSSAADSEISQLERTIGYVEIDPANCTQVTKAISSSNTVSTTASFNSYEIARKAGWEYLRVTSNAARNSYLTFLTGSIQGFSNGASMEGILATGETGRHQIESGGKTVVLQIPADCTVINVQSTTSGAANAPAMVSVLYDSKGAGKVYDLRVLHPSGDTADRTQEINDCLSQWGMCYLTAGDYYTTGVTMPDGSKITGDGFNTRLILASDVSGSAITMGSNCTIDNMSIAGSATEIDRPDTEGTRNGILYQFTGNAQNSTRKGGVITNCWIYYFSGSGILMNNTGWATHGCRVSNNTVTRCYVGLNIAHWSEYHKVSNNIFKECHYGCIDNGGNNILSNCGFDTNFVGLCIDDSGNNHNNTVHGGFSNCTFNHSGNNEGTAILMIGGTDSHILESGMVFSGCNIFYGSIDLTRCYGVSFNGCNFGSGATINVTSCCSILFNGCIFNSIAENTLTISANPGDMIAFNDCYTRYGGVFGGEYATGSFTNSRRIVSMRDTIGAITGNTPMLFDLIGRRQTTEEVGGTPSTSDKSANYVSMRVPCAEGDQFHVHVWGMGATSRGYAFLDANSVVISRSTAYSGGGALIDEVIIAPAGAAYLIVNNNVLYMPSGYYVYKGGSSLMVAFGAGTTSAAVHTFDGTVSSTHPFPNYVAKYLHMDCKNLGVDTTGLLARGGSGTKKNILDQIFANGSALSNADLVIITFGYVDDMDAGLPIGSYDDYYPYDQDGYHPSGSAGIATMLSRGITLMGALNWCIKWIGDHYPKARILPIFGEPSANQYRTIAMTAQTEGPGTAPYKLTFTDPYDDPDPSTSQYGIKQIGVELQKLKKAMNIEVIDMFFDSGSPFNYYDMYATNPDGTYTLFSTTGTEGQPATYEWDAYPNDAGYEKYAKDLAGRISALYGWRD